MSIVTFLLTRQRWYPPTMLPRIESGTRNVLAYSDAKHAATVSQWRRVLSDGPKTRKQIEAITGRKDARGTLFKLRRRGYLVEAGELNGAKLWDWSGKDVLR
jgi:hypothetical protein